MTRRVRINVGIRVSAASLSQSESIPNFFEEGSQTNYVISSGSSRPRTRSARRATTRPALSRIKYKQFDFELTHHKPETWAARMASPTDGASVGPAPPRWYWREEPGRLTAHDPDLVKAPHWVAYADEACERLEAAYAAFAKDPGVPDIVSNVGPARDVSVKTMKQINRKTGFERDVLRE